MSEQLKGTILVTGASSGIGEATVRMLDREGFAVFAGVRKDRDAEALRKGASGALRPVILDITKPEQIRDAVAAVGESVGPDGGLAGLVNNAGICVPGSVENLAMDALRRQMEVNVIGHAAMIQAFLPMIRRGRGRIVNIGSSVGRFALPLSAAYSASKFAMEGLTDALRRELRPWRIPVILIAPGATEAALWERDGGYTGDAYERAPAAEKELYGDQVRAMVSLMDEGLKHAAPPETVARVIRRALVDPRPRSRYRQGPGATMSAFAGWLPDRLTDWAFEKILRRQLPTRLCGW